MAGLAPAAGTGRRNVDLRFGQECQHRFALDAVFTEVQHLRHGIRRAVEHHFREGRQPVPQALVQRPHGGVAALHGFGKAGDRGGKAHGIRQVLGAGAQPALLLAAQIRRLERLHQPVGQVQRTDALGRVDLMAAHRQSVDVVQLDGHPHPRLHGVHMHDGAAVAALDLGRQTLHIVPGTHLVVHHHAGHKDGVFAHMLQHLVDVQRAVGAGLHHGHVVAALCQIFQRALDAGVLEAGHHDVLAKGTGAGGPQQGQIVALAAAGGKIQLLCLAAQGPGHGSAGGVQCFLAAGTGAVQAGGVSPVLPHGLVDDICHLRCHDGGGGIVQIMQFRILQHKGIPAFCFHNNPV